MGKTIIVNGRGMTVAELAEKLLKSSTEEVEEIKKVLREEYGIVLKKEIPKQTNRTFGLLHSSIEEIIGILKVAEKTRQQENARKWYVPKTIGKPCKPKIKCRK